MYISRINWTELIRSWFPTVPTSTNSLLSKSSNKAIVMKITNFAVKNYQFTLIIFLLFAVVGVLTLFTMPRSEDPTIHPPEYLITVIYPGTNPKDMEEQVAKPIENKIYGLKNIDKMLTTIEDGVAAIQVKFKYGVNIDNKYQEISTEINALKNSELPKDIYLIKTEKISSSDV